MRGWTPHTQIHTLTRSHHHHRGLDLSSWGSPWVQPSETMGAGWSWKEGLNDDVVKHLSASDRALDRLNLIPYHYRITLTAAILWLSIDTVPNLFPPSYWFSHPETVCSQRTVNYRAFYRELHLRRKLNRDTGDMHHSRTLPQTAVRNWTLRAVFSPFNHTH